MQRQNKSRDGMTWSSPQDFFYSYLKSNYNMASGISVIRVWVGVRGASFFKRALKYKRCIGNSKMKQVWTHSTSHPTCTQANISPSTFAWLSMVLLLHILQGWRVGSSTFRRGAFEEWQNVQPNAYILYCSLLGCMLASITGFCDKSVYRMLSCPCIVWAWHCRVLSDFIAVVDPSVAGCFYVVYITTLVNRFRCFQALQASCPSACLERFSHLFLLHIWKVLMFEPLLGHVNPQTVSSHMDVVHLEWCCCIFPMIHPNASGPFCSTCRHGVWEVCCSWSRMELESSLTRWAYWLASFARRIDRMTCAMDARVFVGSFVSLFN